MRAYPSRNFAQYLDSSTGSRRLQYGQPVAPTPLAPNSGHSAVPHELASHKTAIAPSCLLQLCQLPAGQQHLLRRPMCSPKFSVWKAGNFEETTFLAGVLLGRANEDAPTASKYDLKAMLRKSGKTNKRLITFQHPAMPNGLPQQPASCIASKPTPAPITPAVSAISKPRGGRSAWGRGLKRSRRGAR